MTPADRIPAACGEDNLESIQDNLESIQES
jgi:hypothetical protein